MERLIKIILFSVIALLPLLLGCGALYVSQQKPLPYWSRNGFFRWINAPEILDRIPLMMIGLLLITFAVVIVLVGILK